MKATWDPVESLDDNERQALHDLLSLHFQGVTPGGFAADLAEKTQVVRLWDDGRLVGFSTWAYARLSWAGTQVGAVWSGDTIVDPAAWNGALLPAAWLAAVRAIHQERGPLAWCLICSGIRTWRMMPVFYRRFAPRDGDLVALRDHLARERYGARFDPVSGLVRLAQPQVLRAHLTTLPDRLLADPLTGDFLRANPRHATGEELACATWIEPANVTPAGRRIWRMADRLLESR